VSQPALGSPALRRTDSRLSDFLRMPVNSPPDQAGTA
jgi:hypothetical protein